MDKIKTKAKNNQIFKPNNPMVQKQNYIPNSNNLSINEPSPNNSPIHNNSNLPNKKKSKNSKQLEISLISLLNAISDLKTKNSTSNSNSNSFSKKEGSNKNESDSSDSEKQGDSYAVMELLTQKTKRNQKYCDACPHREAPHYAKGMCSNCYHSRGRKKKPWKCMHFNKFHYAYGLCQNCYQMKYMKKQNDDGIKIDQSSSNLDFEELSSSINETRKKSDSLNKKEKSKSNRHSKKKIND